MQSQDVLYPIWFYLMKILLIYKPIHMFGLRPWACKSAGLPGDADGSYLKSTWQFGRCDWKRRVFGAEHCKLVRLIQAALRGSWPRLAHLLVEIKKTVFWTTSPPSPTTSASMAYINADDAGGDVVHASEGTCGEIQEMWMEMDGRLEWIEHAWKIDGKS